MIKLKLLVLAICLFVGTDVSAQKIVFRENDFSMQAVISFKGATDSATVKFEFTNTSGKSIFIPVELGLTSKWSKSKGIFMLTFGVDLKNYREFNVPLKEIKEGEKIEENIMIYNHFSDSTVIAILGQYVKGHTTGSKSVYTSKDIEGEDIKWFEYYLDFKKNT